MRPLLKIHLLVPFNEILEVPDLLFTHCLKLSGSQKHLSDGFIGYIRGLHNQESLHTALKRTSVLKCGNILLAQNFIYRVIMRCSPLAN